MLAKFLKLSPLLLVISISACSSKTAITSGMYSGKLPEVMTPDQPVSFVADNGIRFNVAELSVNNIPAPDIFAKRTVSFPPLTRGGGIYNRIAKGDVLGINLPGYPEVVGTSSAAGNSIYGNGFLVDQSGYIQFPMIGRLRAEGLTVAELTSQLTIRLSRYLKHPDPQVRVLSYRGNKFYVDGQVKSPGQFDIADQPINLYTAISMAGGTSEKSDTNNIQLIRAGRTYNFGFKSLQNAGYSPNQVIIGNGDTIKIGDLTENKITVMGEFNKISNIEIPENGISLAGVIGEANGLIGTTANAKKVYVLRENSSNNANIYYVDMTSLTNFSLANRFKMQPGDVVYVDPTGLTRWNRILSQILPSAALPGVVRQF